MPQDFDCSNVHLFLGRQFRIVSWKRQFDPNRCKSFGQYGHLFPSVSRPLEVMRCSGVRETLVQCCRYERGSIWKSSAKTDPSRKQCCEASLIYIETKMLLFADAGAARMSPSRFVTGQAPSHTEPFDQQTSAEMVLVAYSSESPSPYERLSPGLTPAGSLTGRGGAP